MSNPIKKVLANVVQSLSDSEKAQARTNIGALGTADLDVVMVSGFPYNVELFDTWADALDANKLVATYIGNSVITVTYAVHVISGSSNTITLNYPSLNASTGIVYMVKAVYTKVDSETVTHTTVDYQLNKMPTVDVSPTAYSITQQKIASGTLGSIISLGPQFTVLPDETISVSLSANLYSEDGIYDFTGGFITLGMCLVDDADSSVVAIDQSIRVYGSYAQGSTFKVDKQISSTLIYKNTGSTSKTLKLGVKRVFNSTFSGDLYVYDLCLGKTSIKE